MLPQVTTKFTPTIHDTGFVLNYFIIYSIWFIDCDFIILNWLWFFIEYVNFGEERNTSHTTEENDTTKKDTNVTEEEDTESVINYTTGEEYITENDNVATENLRG